MTDRATQVPARVGIAIEVGVVELALQPPASRAIRATPPTPAHRRNRRDRITSPSIPHRFVRPLGNVETFRSLCGPNLSLITGSGRIIQLRVLAYRELPTLRHFGGRCGLVDSRSCKHGCVPIPDDSLRSVIRESPNEREQHRRSLWEYYDRRVTGRLPGLANAHAYWTGLGVTVEV